MTRLVTSGFEVYAGLIPGSGDTGAFGEVGAPDGGTFSLTTVTRSTTGQRSGRAALRVVEGASTVPAQEWKFPGVIDRTYFFRVYMRIVTLRSSNRILLAGDDFFGSGSGVQVSLDTSGRVFGPDNVTSVALNDGSYHRIELSFRASATQANRTWALRVDGTPVSSGTSQTQNAAAPIAVSIVFFAATPGEFFFDDVALNDDQGAAPHNTWPGAGYVICLLPTADNSRGTWTGGAGGTTSLFDALNNTPPLGATAPGTNTSQISANAVATTGKFDTESYVSAGAGASDTAVCCAVVACTGEQAATGTKSGSASTDTAVNNSPSSATATLNYGLDVGAEAAWPQFWRWWASPFTAYSSQPTLSSGARLNIITTTTSRVADCCFLGLIAEMQPAAVVAAIPDVGMALTVT